jgi:hypothetical protein
MQKKYLYIHGKDNTIELFKLSDLSLVATLNTDNKRIIIAKETNDEKVFIACEGGVIFLFSLIDFSRIKKDSVAHPGTAAFIANDQTIILG